MFLPSSDFTVEVVEQRLFVGLPVFDHQKIEVGLRQSSGVIEARHTWTRHIACDHPTWTCHQGNTR